MIYTLGHSNRTIEDFLDILKKYEIDVILDVRRFPKSKFSHFGEELKHILSANGIDYVHLSELGGYRKGGYRKYMESKDFSLGIEKVLSYLEKKACILCAERFPWRCHRRHISRELGRRGVKVIHIIDVGREQKNRKE